MRSAAEIMATSDATVRLKAIKAATAIMNVAEVGVDTKSWYECRDQITAALLELFKKETTTK
jgi:hypothetical protein